MGIQPSKDTAKSFLQSFERLAPDNTQRNLKSFLSKDSHWFVSHPHNELCGSHEVVEKLWEPFLESFPDTECAPDIFLAGIVEEKHVVASTGYFRSVFAKDWLGIPASGQPVFIRFGIFMTIEKTRITKAMLILDILSLLKQVGAKYIPQSLGTEIVVPGPMTKDGLLYKGWRNSEGNKSLERVDAMLSGLQSYDGKSKESMGQTRFWHPKMMWYGPAGIGTARTLKGFEDFHQLPFLRAFPNRKVADLKVFFGEGNYVATGAMPSMTATHTGGDWLGLPPTGKHLSLRVFDFWRVENDLLRENWVLIDMPHILLQMGTDVLSRNQCLPVNDKAKKKNDNVG